MANWQTLKTAVNEVIKTNGSQQITGQALQNVLNNIITSLGENASFKGVATPSTNPGTPDGPVFYVAFESGLYSNFSGIEVEDGNLTFLKWSDNAWSKESISMIVNDFSTGGAGKALSAERGKELKRDVDNRFASVAASFDAIATSSSHEVEILSTHKLEAESGGQTAFIPINIRRGTPYEITISSTTSNDGYAKVGTTTLNKDAIYFHEGNLWHDFSVEPLIIQYTPEENGAGLSVYIRGIAEEGTLTIQVKYTENDVTIKAQTKVDVKPGVNLAIERDYMVGCYIDTDLNYNCGRISLRSTTNCSNYIKLSPGESLICNKYSQSYVANTIALFEKPGDLLAIPDTFVRHDSGVPRIITNNLDKDVYAVFSLNASTDKYQIEKGTQSSGYQPYSEVAGYFETDSIYGYGAIGSYYPEQARVIADELAMNNAIVPKLHFVHISDNHGGSLYPADELTDLSPASFLVNTGDMVTDKFTDSYDKTIESILGMSKPGYVVLGNHDCSESKSLQARYDKFISPLNSHNGLSGNRNTYYSVDYDTEKVKCVFLDMNDGRDNVAGLPMNNLISSSLMSRVQIEWFASQLQHAAENNYHVICFIHVSPALIDTDKILPNWFDVQLESANGVSFLADMIDAFLAGSSVEFIHNGNQFSFSFAKAGHFIGWMTGHTHYDSCGWLQGHPKQFVVAITNNYQAYITDGTYFVGELKTKFNYVTISTETRHLAVKRVGCDRTIYGTMRDAFDILYW